MVSVFRGSTFTAFGIDLLPSDSIVSRIGEDNRRRATQGVQDVCKEPLEDFVPAYVGRELALAEKKKAIQARKNASFLSGPQFMEHWMGFRSKAPHSRLSTSGC